MSLFLVERLESVGAQQRRDHVDGDEQGAGRIDELDQHGSDPSETDGVEGEQTQDENAKADVNDVANLEHLHGSLEVSALLRPSLSARIHGVSLEARQPCQGFAAVQCLWIGLNAVSGPFRSGSTRIRKS